MTSMEQIVGEVEGVMNQQLAEKLSEINATAQEHLAGVNDHVNFKLQKEYFKCANECFDGGRKHGEIRYCVTKCSVPVIKAQSIIKHEIARFQDRLSTSLKDCQDQYTAAKVGADGGNARNDLESCIDLSFGECINFIPFIAANLKEYLEIDE